MRNRYFFFLDLLGLAAAPFVVLFLRFEGAVWPDGYVATAIAFALVWVPAQLVIAYYNGLYRCLWRYASILEMERIVIAGIIGALAAWIIGSDLIQIAGLAPQRMPYSALALNSLLTLAVLATPRLGVRYRYVRGRRSERTGVRSIVVGAGVAGQLVAREASTSERADFQVVGFVDDDRQKLGQFLHGVEVYGTTADLPQLVRDLSADQIIIAMPSAPGRVLRQIVEVGVKAGVRIYTVPSYADLATGRVAISTLRPVQIEDLLRRAPITTDIAAVRGIVGDKVVLVTGAGGSIGSELCRQIANLAPTRLVVLDHSENQVFEIEQELRRRFPALAITPVIADIRDRSRVRPVFERHQPYAVFHAAAHKHVPLMEENVVEAITNNILGTRNLVDAALDHGVEHFVLISTDKAVRPTSIMGATKQIAESVVRLTAIRENKHYVAVRFGNVLGSRGSVIPTFLEQMKRGGPVTVTHPEMRRFFMTIPEAVQLVLQAGALGSAGELFVLDMGEAVKIADLARDLIRLSGFTEGVDMELQFTGMRPGEKLYEELFFGDEDVRPTDHPKVMRVLAEAPAETMDGRIDDLLRMVQIDGTDERRLRQAINDLVPDALFGQAAEMTGQGAQKRSSGDAKRQTQ
jgi:FlaA1/EpsC-like NDP-sugar epimerase